MSNSSQPAFRKFICKECGWWCWTDFKRYESACALCKGEMELWSEISVDPAINQKGEDSNGRKGNHRV